MPAEPRPFFCPMTKSNLSANPSNRTILVWLLASVLALVAIIFAPIASLLNLFHDDSFFYMVIARNHAAGLGYSFDGLNATNGFHLLWLWTLSYLGTFIALTGDQGIRVVVALQTLLSLSAALIYVRMLRAFKVSSLVQILFFLAFIFLCTLADIGQESALYSFLVALIVSMLFTVRADAQIAVNWSQLVMLLILVVLTVLSRLDCVFLLGGIALALVLAQRKQEAFVVSLGIALGLASTFSFNYLEFGHVYSISSWLKSGFDVSKALQLLIPGLLIRVALVFLLLGGALWQLKKAHAFAGLRMAPSKLSFVALFIISVTLAYGAYFAVLFLEVSALGSWYFNQALGLSAFLYALSFSKEGTLLQSSNSLHHQGPARSSMGLWPFISLPPLLLAFGVGAILFVTKFSWAHSSDATKEIGDWIYGNTKLDAVIFQRDGAGAVSYFAQRSIINGDGLVNNMQYQVMLRSGKLCNYLNDQKVAYIVSNTDVGSTGQIQDYIFLWTKGLTSLPLTNVAPSLALYTTQASPHYRIFQVADAVTVCKK